MKPTCLWCRRHENLRVSFINKATTEEEATTVQDTLSDPVKGELALEAFGEAKDKHGKKYLCRLACVHEQMFTEWSDAVRERMVLMDAFDFVSHYENRLGKAAAVEGWNKTKKGPKCMGYEEYEGEVNTESLLVWVPASKEQFKDKSRGIAKGYDQQSKPDNN